jgi:hypothetical protein
VRELAKLNEAFAPFEILNLKETPAAQMVNNLEQTINRLK